MNPYLAHYGARMMYGQEEAPPASPSKPPFESTPTQRAVSTALFGTAAALSYTRDRKPLKAFGAGIIAPFYLIYRGVEYLQER